VIKRLSSLLLQPLLWLMLLALPLVSQAAAAALPCHHVQAQAVAVRMAGMDGAAHGAPVVMHDQAGRTQDCALRGHGEHRAGNHDHDHGRCGHCASCGACCAGVALAPALPTAPPGAGAAFVAIPFRAGHVPSVDPSLPERPPRALLA
jgi:hypothetical protein